MSFSEFLQWIRNFFNSRSAPNTTAAPSTSGTVKPQTSPHPECPPSSDSISSSSTLGASTSSTTAAPPSVETPLASTPPPISATTGAASREITQPEAVTSPHLPETTQPEVATPPPTLQRITTTEAKVTLNQEVIFQIVTSPANQYADCSLDLNDASHASVVRGIDSRTGQFSLSFDKASKSDGDTQLIKVKNPQGEVSTSITVSLMKLFWHNHPGRKNVCDETLFVNQCAIRMSTALELSGIKLSQDRRVLRRCTTEYRAFKHHKDGLVNGHVLAAQELANWIKSQRSTFGSRSIVHSQEEILGRSGIIFFRDGWGTTDHIDVWDGQSLVGGFPDYFESDFKELWFWDVY